MPSNFGGKEKSFSQCSTVRTHDPEHNQDLILNILVQIIDRLNISIVRWRGQSQRTIEILPECVGDFTVLHFLPVFDFIPHLGGKSTQLSLKVAAGKSIDTVKDNRDTNLINKRFLPVFDFIPHFYQLFLVSCLFNSYVLLAGDHVIIQCTFSFNIK
jgi:hypothetical protein